jgi:hypothetical protein
MSKRSKKMSQVPPTFMNQVNMSPEQAWSILQQSTGMLQATRAEHMQISLALQVLQPVSADDSLTEQVMRPDLRSVNEEKPVAEDEPK